MMIYEWLYVTLYDWGDEESPLIVASMSQGAQAILSIHLPQITACLSL